MRTIRSRRKGRTLGAVLVGCCGKTTGLDRDGLDRGRGAERWPPRSPQHHRQGVEGCSASPKAEHDAERARRRSDATGVRAHLEEFLAQIVEASEGSPRANYLTDLERR